MTDRPALRVFIYGSCVSRDSFEYFDRERFELVEYVARQSLVSAFSAPGKPLIDTSTLCSPFQRRLLNLDARSGLPDRLRERADEIDILLWDLFDERLGYYRRSKGRVVTNSVELIAHNRRTGTTPTERLVPYGTHRHRVAFREHLQSFASLLDETGLRDKLVLVAPEWAERTDTGELTPSSFGLSAERANDVFANYFRAIRSIVKPGLVISLADTMAAADHQWGVAPFHYVPQVYRDIASAVGNLADSGDISATLARQRANQRRPARAPRVAVIGRGFVGTAVIRSLRDRGARVRVLPAPRLGPVQRDELSAHLAGLNAQVAELAEQLHGCTAVVNAAGRAEPGSDDLPGLLAANALLPAVIARAAQQANVTRFIHVSSAAVQGNRSTLDSSTEFRPFSAYSHSKAVGERLALAHHPGTVVYRPAGVQGLRRGASARLVATARSPFASVASPGRGNSPQALVQNVGDAAAFLALTEREPPRIVHHPSEGVTVARLLELLSGTPPRRVPAPFAVAVLGLLRGAARVVPSLGARVRRLEVMWQGQAQAPSWLTEAGWEPMSGPEGWRRLGNRLA